LSVFSVAKFCVKECEDYDHQHCDNVLRNLRKYQDGNVTANYNGLHYIHYSDRIIQRVVKDKKDFIMSLNAKMSIFYVKVM